MTARVVVATPSMRTLTADYVASLWAMARDPLVAHLLDPLFFVDHDLERARSRAVRMFLRETIGTHLLLWDQDIEGSARVLHGMLEERVPAIGATYPRKLAREDGRPVGYALHTLGQPLRYQGNRAAVPGVGLGFMLLERGLLERMTRELDEELHAEDMGKRTTFLFALRFGRNAEGTRVRWPEDFSFCQRVAEAGETVWLYTGPGSPLTHVGMHAFVGRAEEVHPRSRPPAPIDNMAEPEEPACP